MVVPLVLARYCVLMRARTTHSQVPLGEVRHECVAQVARRFVSGRASSLVCSGCYWRVISATRERLNASVVVN